MRRLFSTTALAALLVVAQVGQIGWTVQPAPSGGGGGITHVQGILGADGSSATATTIAVSFGSAVGSGHFVACAIAADDGTPVLTSATDDKSNTYHVSALQDDTSTSERIGIIWLGNITNGPTTITATFSATIDFRRIVCDEFSGILAAGDPSDGTHGAIGSSTTPNGGSFTPGTSGDLIYGGVETAQHSGGGAISATGSFVIGEAGTQPNSVPLASEYFTQSVAGAINSAFSLPVTGTWGSIGYAFKP